MNFYIYIRDIADNPDALTLARRLLDLQMQVEPVGAFVRDEAANAYRFLAIGAVDLVDVDSDECRAILAAELDVPDPLDTVEIVETSVTQEDEARELQLRQRLSASAKERFDLLNVVGRVRGFGPRDGVDATRSPDIVLIAPAKQSFSGGTSTHGALGYPLTRIPMLFCGPAVETTEEIAEADLVDFAPTIMALLGFQSDEISNFGMDGRALLDYQGRPMRLGRGPRLIRDDQRFLAAAAPSGPTEPRDHRLSVLAHLRVASSETTTLAAVEKQPALPAIVELAIRETRSGQPRLHDRGIVLHRFSGAELDGLLDEPGRCWHVEDVQVGAGRRCTLEWTDDACDADAELAYVEVQSNLGDHKRGLRLPRAVALQSLVLEVPRVPEWLDGFLRGAEALSTPYTLDFGIGDKSSRKYPIKTNSESNAYAGRATADRPRRHFMLEAEVFHLLVATVASSVDGAQLTRAEDRIVEALSAPAPPRRQSAWENGVRRLLCGWELVEQAARSPNFSASAYAAAIETLVTMARELPRGLREATQLAARHAIDAPATLRPGSSDGERIRIACEAIPRLLSASELLQVLYVPLTRHDEDLVPTAAVPSKHG
jgi:hypothetical protein